MSLPRLLAISALIATAVAYLAITVVVDHQWTGFRLSHGCQVIGYEDADTRLRVSTRDPEEARSHAVADTGYRCDDGQEYWR